MSKQATPKKEGDNFSEPAGLCHYLCYWPGCQPVNYDVAETLSCNRLGPLHRCSPAVQWSCILAVTVATLDLGTGSARYHYWDVTLLPTALVSPPSERGKLNERFVGILRTVQVVFLNVGVEFDLGRHG